MPEHDERPAEEVEKEAAAAEAKSRCGCCTACSHLARLADTVSTPTRGVCAHSGHPSFEQLSLTGCVVLYRCAGLLCWR